jgi:hypothetical protein
MTKGRKVPPPTPEQLRQRKVETTIGSEEAWKEAEQTGTLPMRQIACGVTQSAASGLYHTWISLYGTDLTSWGVYRDQARAEQLADEIGQLFSGWTHDDAAAARMDALLQKATAESDAPNTALPDDQVREILAAVADRVRRQN